LLHQAIFPAKNEIELIHLIIDTIGSPNETIWPGYSELPIVKLIQMKHQPYNNLKQKFPWLSDTGYRLLNGMFMYCPERRITATEAIKHLYFQERPLPMLPSMMPNWSEYRSKRSKRGGGGGANDDQNPRSSKQSKEPNDNS
jgi:cyclin-dependent kinase 10